MELPVLRLLQSRFYGCVATLSGELADVAMTSAMKSPRPGHYHSTGVIHETGKPQVKVCMDITHHFNISYALLSIYVQTCFFHENLNRSEFQAFKSLK
ncbi:hypothetical protein C0J52_14570 [Blattella germanica]|nr:hypothetical protein C0J52_14570 [Blattella germanica]